MRNRFLLITACTALAFAAGCTKKEEPAQQAAAKTEQVAADAAAPAAGAPAAGLKIEDTKVGTGAEAVAGKRVTVHYTGTLTDGKKFDSSLDRGQPFSFNLGAGQVIQGWEKGIAGMKVGGKRKLTIPPEMGYGDQAVGPIPAKSTLLFDVELLKVE